jgi:radical SAM protein with 4Fe4S-binding SPASM domain
MNSLGTFSINSPPQDRQLYPQQPDVSAYRCRLFADPQLAFVVFASPKSGTTWLQRLISAHPAAVCAESRAFGDYLGSNAAGFPHLTMEKYLRVLSQYLAPSVSSLSSHDEGFYRLLLFDWLDVLAASARSATGKRVYGEKATPYPGTALAVIDSLHRYNPDLKFVHLVRDGRDVIVSGAAQWQHQRCGSVSEQESQTAERQLKDRELRDDDFQRFLETWIDSVSAGLAARERFPNWLELRYESLLAEPSVSVSKLFNFLEIDSHPELVRKCLDAVSFEKLSGGRKPGQEDGHSFFRKGVAGDWRNWFDARHVSAFDNRAGELLARLGYSGSEVPAKADAGSVQTGNASGSSSVSRGGLGKLVVMAPDSSHPLYQSWIPDCPLPLETVSRYNKDWVPPSDTALLLTHDTYTEPARTILRRAVAAGIPTLILADGIIEYRNTWEHPQLEPGAVFQPVLGHKIATIGRSQTRILESWGNFGKCETVGSPRFDRYMGRQRRIRQSEQPFRVLVGTALTPYFTELQRQKLLTSLWDLKAFFQRAPSFGGVRIEPVWRLTLGLAEELGVENTMTGPGGKGLPQLLEEVDAVVTTPSTVLLEAMLLELPTAVLDYGNVPHYLSTAWRITAPTQIEPIIWELVQPPEPKLLFQQTMLHDALECVTPAGPRLLRLIDKMVEAGQRAKRTGGSLQLPTRILPSEPDLPCHVPSRFKLDRLFSSPASAMADAERVVKPAQNPPAHSPILPPPLRSARIGTPSGNRLNGSTQNPTTVLGPVPARPSRGGLSKADPHLAKIRQTIQKATESVKEGHQVLATLLLEEVLEMDPENSQAKQLLAQLQDPPADLDQAGPPSQPSAVLPVHLASAIRSFGAKRDLTRTEVPELTAGSERCYQEGNFVEAAKLSLELLRIDATSASYGLLLLGNCLYQLEETELAREAFGTILQFDPDNVVARDNLLVVDKKVGRLPAVETVGLESKSRRVPPRQLITKALNILKCHFDLALEAMPSWVNFQTSFACNLRCPHCQTHGTDQAHRQYQPIEMPAPLLQSVSEQTLPWAESYSFTLNGEPLLTRNWPQLLERFGGFGARLDLTTNGTLLNEKTLPLLVPRLGRVCVSLDGATQQTSELLRQGIHYGRLLHNIKLTSRVLQAVSGRYAIPMELALTAMGSNVHELPVFVELAHWLGVHQVSIYPVIPFSERVSEFEDLSRHKGRYNFFVAQAIERARELGIALVAPPAFAGEPAVPVQPGGMAGLFGGDVAPLSGQAVPDFERYVDVARLNRAVLAVVKALEDRPVGVAEAGAREGQPHSDMIDSLITCLRTQLADSAQNQERVWTCDFVTHRMYVAHNGDVAPCCVPGRPALGNVARESVSAVWNGERYRAFRQQLVSDAPQSPCRDCGWRKRVTKQSLLRPVLEELIRAREG